MKVYSIRMADFAAFCRLGQRDPIMTIDPLNSLISSLFPIRLSVCHQFAVSLRKSPGQNVEARFVQQLSTTNKAGRAGFENKPLIFGRREFPLFHLTGLVTGSGSECVCVCIDTMGHRVDFCCSRRGLPKCRRKPFIGVKSGLTKRNTFLRPTNTITMTQD